jgi:transposase
MGHCGGCFKRGPTYDTAKKPRQFSFIPFWGFTVVLLYCMRRIDCAACGVTTELIPWADGKQKSCYVYRQFLATWAKRMSWSEVGRVFHVSWGVVFRSVEWVVQWGLEHRELSGVKAIGIDEIAVWKGHKYLTIVYQIDEGVRRLLWVGRDRTEATLEDFFKSFGKINASALAFVASDMWKPYIKVINKWAPAAVHVLDRFHIVAKLNKAIDEVRAGEARRLAAEGFDTLKKTRWCFLKNPKNLSPSQKKKLKDVLQYDLRTVRAYLHKEAFEAFWKYTSPTRAAWFLDQWCKRVMRSQIPQLKKFVGTMRSHKPLIMNWFIAKKQISSAVVESLNGNAKLAIRKARGFRTIKALEIALFHQMGTLPEPSFITHRFW